MCVCMPVRVYVYVYMCVCTHMHTCTMPFRWPRQEFFFTPPHTLTPGRSIAPGQVGTNPAWISFSRSTRAERVVYVADESSPGRVFARGWPSEGPNLFELLDTQPSDLHGAQAGGDAPVALALLGAAADLANSNREEAGPGALVVANYVGGSAGLLQLRQDGGFDAVPPAVTTSTLDKAEHSAVQKRSDKDPDLEKSDKRPDGLSVFPFHRAEDAPIGPVSSRQSASYAHEAVTAPDGRSVYLPDLGTDEVHLLKVHRKSEHAPLSLKRGDDTPCLAGAGPRHIAFYPPGLSTVGGRLGTHGSGHPAASTAVDHKAQHAYLAQELTCTVQAFNVSDSGALASLGSPILAAPPGVEIGGTPTAGPDRTTSEVVVSPDGRFVYVGTRGDAQEDHIAIFVRTPSDGALSFREWVSSGGKTPRHFSISLDRQARYVAVANQDSSLVTMFQRDPDQGGLTRIAEATVEFPNAGFAGFAPNA